MATKTFSFSDLSHISRSDLANLIRQKPTTKLSIIDVRDDDYLGGHIAGAQNVPSSTLDYRTPELVRTLKNKDMVIFHCALSQQRGPSAALRYLRERQSMYDRGALGEKGGREDREDLIEKQKVLVLDGGFKRWQEAYGTDKELTEDYVPDMWDQETRLSTFGKGTA